MPNLYDAIGVEPDADPKAIRAGWKRAIKRAHPDAGGTREHYDLVQTALMVLSDPKRREQYDRTGKYDAEPEPDNETAKVHSLLADCIQAIVYGDLTDAALTRIDMVRRIKELLAEPRQECRQVIAKTAKLKARAERLRGRFVVAIGDDAGQPMRLMDKMIQRRIEWLDEETAKATAMLSTCDKVEAILDTLVFSQDADEPAMFYSMRR